MKKLMSDSSRIHFIRPALICISAVLCMSVFLMVQYHLNNKYTRETPVNSDGITILTEEALDNSSVTFPARGWTYFPGKLYEPGEVPEYGQTITIGDVPSHMEALKTPYGSATYRLKLRYTGSPRTVSIQFPEILCASRVYINEKLAGITGEVSASDYSPLVKDRVYSFLLRPDNEIIVQTANYSHYYSGLYYPPAIGSPDAVVHMVSMRLLLYSFLCISALTLAVSNIFLWLGNAGKDRAMYLMLGILDLSFAFHVSYPFFRAAGIPLVRILYALEDVSGFTSILCTVMITFLLCRLDHLNAYRRCLLPCAVGMCLFGLLVPLFLLPAVPELTAVYGILVSAYKLLVSFVLIAVSFYGIYLNQPFAKGVLFAVTISAVGLFYEVTGINKYEPIYAGWPGELGTWALVLAFAVIIAGKSRAVIQENNYLNQCLLEEVAKKTASLNSLLEERKKFLKSLTHDLKTPLTAIRNYLHLIGEQSSDDSSQYFPAVLSKTQDLEHRLEMLQEFTAHDLPASSFSRLDFAQFLEEFYRINRPDIELEGQRFTLSLPREPCMITGSVTLLTRLLENLCYNALSFTPCGGTISLTLVKEQQTAILTVRDTGSGILPEDLPHIFEWGYSKRTGQPSTGLGLFIAKTIVLEHQGYITASSVPGEYTVFTVELPVR